jgi:hypothetical protein
MTFGQIRGDIPASMYPQTTFQPNTRAEKTADFVSNTLPSALLTGLHLGKHRHRARLRRVNREHRWRGVRSRTTSYQLGKILSYRRRLLWTRGRRGVGDRVRPRYRNSDRRGHRHSCGRRHWMHHFRQTPRSESTRHSPRYIGEREYPRLTFSTSSSGWFPLRHG